MSFDINLFINITNHLKEQSDSTRSCGDFLKVVNELSDEEFNSFKITSASARYLSNFVRGLEGYKSSGYLEDAWWASFSESEKKILYSRLRVLNDKAYNLLVNLLIEKEANVEINSIKSKGSGRPTKEEKNRISILQSRLERKAEPKNDDDLFFKEIEMLAKNLGSKNKAYLAYSEEVNKNKETIRRRFERLKKKL